MWRFVLAENVRRLQLLLARADSEQQRDKLRIMLEEAQSELADLEQASTPELARRDEAMKYFAQHAVDEAVKLHNAQFGTLQIYNETRGALIILAQRNFRPPFLHHLENVRPGDGSACGRCLSEGDPVAIGDVNQDALFEPHREAARLAGFQAVQASPIRDGSGDLIAVLSTYFSNPHVFSDEEMDRRARLAQSIGMGLEKYVHA